MFAKSAAVRVSVAEIAPSPSPVNGPQPSAAWSNERTQDARRSLVLRQRRPSGMSRPDGAADAVRPMSQRA